MTIDGSVASDIYEKMVLIRRFEEESSRLYMQGKIRGFLHLYIGQEAVAAGVILPLRQDDYIITHYRDHGHALARGMDPKIAMAELLGKATGSSGGCGGSMHLFDVEKGFMGGYAIVGSQMPIAAGLALAAKYRKEDRVVVCFLGDGAVQEGEFHESMNLAAVWKLPVLFVLENNLFAMGTPIEMTRAGGKDIYLAADSYKMLASQVDGMDVLAVHEATTQAIQQIREGRGPVFIEAMTYRFVGHSVQDPQVYRDSKEVEAWRVKDPIKTFSETAVAGEALTEDQIEAINQRVEETIGEAVDFAERSPEPEIERLYDNVYG